MIIEGYTLHLYCENTGEPGSELYTDHVCALRGYQHFAEVGGGNRRAAWREARNQGWRIGRGKAYCPGCTDRALRGQYEN